MTKNLKLSFILLFSISAIIIAWRNLTSILGGTGLIFVGLLTILMLLLSINLTDKACFKRTKDLFFTSCFLVTLETIIYFALEFPINASYNAVRGFLIVQNIFSVLAILFFAYITFRFICELKEVKIGFIEFILGNKSTDKKIKKSKEIFNGSLEDKPMHLKETQPIEETQPQTEELENVVEDANVENFEE